jgi:hypothetical protein
VGGAEEEAFIENLQQARNFLTAPEVRDLFSQALL